MVKRFFQRQKDKRRAVDVRLESMEARLDNCAYMLADDGKDKVVNRRLFKRSEQLHSKANRLERIANKLESW